MASPSFSLCSTMTTPILEPWAADFTTTGMENSARISAVKSLTPSTLVNNFERGVGIAADKNIRFETPLSMAIALASTPEPV